MTRKNNNNRARRFIYPSLSRSINYLIKKFTELRKIMDGY